MNYTQTWMRRALRVVALLGLVGMGGAWGQDAQNSEPFKTDRGCTGFDWRSSKSLRSIKWDGECKSGKLNGTGVLQYEFITQSNETLKFVFIGYKLAGLTSGAYLVARCVENGKPMCLSIGIADPDPHKSFAINFARNREKNPQSNPVDINTILETKADVINRAAGLPSVRLDDTEELLRTWVANSDMPLSTFVNFKPRISVRSDIRMNSEDDPKVFGRSARSR